jgi:hypothetical protein
MRIALGRKKVVSKSKYATVRSVFGGIGGKPDKNKKNRRNGKRRFNPFPTPYPTPTPNPEFPKPPKLLDDEGIYAKRKKYTRRKKA